MGSRTHSVSPRKTVGWFCLVTIQTGQNDIERVREATDLVNLIGEHIALRPKGREHVGLCPFHDDHTPSFCVVTHKGNAFYKCHACDAAGDAFDFFMEFHRVDFPTALRELAQRAGVELTRHRPTTKDSREQVLAANRLAADWFRAVLQHPVAGESTRRILDDRGFDETVRDTFEIGMAPPGWDGLLKTARKKGFAEADLAAAGLLKQRHQSQGHYDTFRNRIIFPICNDLGQPIAFGGRKIDPEDEPKYLNSPESSVFHKSRTLYGMHLAKRAIIDQRRAIVTEGYTDVIACHQAGVRNVVATLGTALTPEHAGLLGRCCDTVTLVFDGDEAGQKAADRAIEVFFREPVDIHICVLPDGLDPGELLAREGGPEEFRSLLSQAVDALSYRGRRFQDALREVQGPAAKQRLLSEFLDELLRLGFEKLSGVRRRPVLAQLSDLLGVPVDEIERFIRASKARGHRRPTAAAADEATASAAEDELLLTGLSPARRRAERTLLAIGVFAPEVFEAKVGEQRLIDAIRDRRFLDGVSAAIGASLISLHERGHTITVQTLRADLETEQAKQLAASLFFDGQAFVEAHERQDSMAAATEALEALDACAVRSTRVEVLTDFRQRERSGDQADADAASAVLAELRRTGDDPLAIPRGVR